MVHTYAFGSSCDNIPSVGPTPGIPQASRDSARRTGRGPCEGRRTVIQYKPKRLSPASREAAVGFSRIQVYLMLCSAALRALGHSAVDGGARQRRLAQANFPGSKKSDD
jgi:hypothetical protein